MRKKSRHFFVQQIAFFLCFLVLTIPFISSQAYALTITKVTVVGSDGIENIMSSDNDYFAASVETSEEVDPSQIEITYSKQESFDECSGTSCTYTSSSADRSGQEMGYTIQLINNSIVVDEAEGTIIIDEEAPEISEYTIEKSADDIIISYEISDTACEECSGCAGIDYISVLQDETEIQQINIASDCDVSDELETTVSELNLEDGDHELCMIAVDNVGHESDESCELISVDSVGPYFETNSLSIKEAVSGNTLEYIGQDAVLVDISINVSDTALNQDSITADFSNLNGVIGDTYANMTPNSCDQSTDDETGYFCTWNSIYIEDVSGTLQILFYAQDNEGNEGTYSPSFTLTKDESAPAVVQAYNEAGSEDLYFKSGTNSLYVDFDPTGSALSYGRAYLTFGLASLNQEDATSCFENGSYWTCVWNFSMSYFGTAASTITIDATDDAGNEMEPYDFDVGTDSTEPEILSIESSLDCPTSSDTMEVMINATDDSEHLYASFYGEDIRTNDDPVTEECIDIGDGTFNCILNINDFVSYAEDENVDIEIYDDAGNIADEEISISVCELEESGTPNLVTLYVDENDLAAVDKLTLSYIDYPLYVPITFSMPSSANIVSKTASCEAGSAYFIDQSDTSSLLVMTLPQQTVPNATMYLTVNCSVSMTMQYGDNVYSNPETDSVEFTIDLYGTPLGSIEDAIGANVDAQRYWIIEKQRSIDRLVTLNRVLGIMCKLADIMAKVNSIYSGIRVVLTAIGSAAATRPVAIMANTLGDVIYHIVATYFWPVGTLGGFGGTVVPQFGVSYTDFDNNLLGFIGGTIKGICIVYSGKLCEGYAGIENAIIAEQRGSKGYYEAYYGDTTYAKNPADTEHTYQLFSDWDPYKSIHTARSCLYIDAYIYNLRKERQINCMYTKCLEDNAKNGLPTDICDVQFKQRECLYVNGAVWSLTEKKFFAHFVELTLNTALSNLDIFAFSFGYYAACGWYDKSIRSSFAYAKKTYGYNSLALMWASTGCHVYAGTLTLMETNWFQGTMDFDFQANLEGTDYCVGYE